MLNHIQRPSFAAITAHQAQTMQGQTVKMVGMGPSLFDTQYIEVSDYTLPDPKYLATHGYNNPPGFEGKTVYLDSLFLENDTAGINEAILDLEKFWNPQRSTPLTLKGWSINA